MFLGTSAGLCSAHDGAPQSQSRWLVVILTFLPASAMLPNMTSLLQTGSGMFLDHAGRCRPGCAEKRSLINNITDNRDPVATQWLPVTYEPSGFNDVLSVGVRF
jgi:hypothetical protein